MVSTTLTSFIYILIKNRTSVSDERERKKANEW